MLLASVRVDDRGDVDLESSEFNVGAKIVELAGGESHMRSDDDQTAGHSGALRCSGGVLGAHDVLRRQRSSRLLADACAHERWTHSVDEVLSLVLGSDKSQTQCAQVLFRRDVRSDHLTVG